MTRLMATASTLLILITAGCSTNEQQQPSNSLEEKIEQTEEKLEGLNERFERLNGKLDQLIEVMEEDHDQ